jgi:hypothetical protein
VFAAYGLALYLSQCLERGLATLLTLHEAPAQTHRAAITERLAENQDGTFGTLADRAAGCIEDHLLGAEVLALKEIRNRLAHKYFYEMAVPFTTGSGCREMAAQLHGWAERFRTADKALQPSTLEMLQRRGVGTARLKVAMSELIAGAIEDEPVRLPKVVRIVSASSWHPEGNPEPGFMPVFLAEDGMLLVLGDTGLCTAPGSLTRKQLRTLRYPSAALPCEVKRRPSGATPWNYTIPLAGGFALKVRPGEASGYPYRFGFSRMSERKS